MAEVKKVRVKLKTCLAGSGFVLNTGDTHDCDQAEAGRLVAAGFAVLDDGAAAAEVPQPKPETPRGRGGRPPRTARADEPPSRPIVTPPADPPADDPPAS